MTHGLPYLTPEMFYGDAVPGWSRDFDAWAAEALADRAIDELAAFRAKAPGLPYAHPTVEHFTPLFVDAGRSRGRDHDPGGRVRFRTLETVAASGMTAA